MEVISSGQALHILSRSLGLPLPRTDSDWHTWLYSFMREVCSIHCPSPRGKLIRISTELVEPLIKESCKTEIDLEQILEGLSEVGDIIELSSFLSGEIQYRGDWVFCRPPSFLSNGNRTYLIGIASGGSISLPTSLRDKVNRQGPHRFIDTPSAQEKVDLSAYGFEELLKDFVHPTPKMEAASEYLQRAKNKLSVAPPATLNREIRIHTRSRSKSCKYKERWHEPQTESGHYVFRRPSEYGADHWCLGEFDNGTLRRFVDLPFIDENVRGCDAAWRLQLAIDFVDGAAATYQLYEADDHFVINFSSPVPLWLKRRHRAAAGRETGSPFCIVVPKAEWPEERQIIEDILWFKKVDA